MSQHDDQVGLIKSLEYLSLEAQIAGNPFLHHALELLVKAQKENQADMDIAEDLVRVSKFIAIYKQASPEAQNRVRSIISTFDLAVVEEEVRPISD